MMNHESFVELRHDSLSPLITCPFCANPLCKPVTALCGHTYCHNCIIKNMLFSPRCPVCKVTLQESDLFPNKPLEDLIGYLQTTELAMASKANFSANPFDSQSARTVASAENSGKFAMGSSGKKRDARALFSGHVAK